MFIRAYPRHSINLDPHLIRIAFACLTQHRATGGPNIGAFERLFAEYIGVPYAVGASSARFALYAVLRAFDFKPGDEIIMPAYTFFALPQVIKQSGLEPVFVDVDESSCTIDPSLIGEKITSKTKAILVTHMFGQPCRMDEIIGIARRNGLRVIEDCAHALGAFYKDRKAGSLGDAAIFSFQMGKNMPCFRGGIVTLSSQGVHDKVRNFIEACPYPTVHSLTKEFIKTTALYFLTRKRLFPWTFYPIIRIFDFLGIPFFDEALQEHRVPADNSPPRGLRLSNLQASVGIEQLGKIDAFNSRMRNNAALLTKALHSTEGIRVPDLSSDVESTCLYYYIKVQRADEFRKSLLKRGIDTKKDDMSVCSSQKIFQESRHPASYPAAEKLAGVQIEVPNNPSLDQEDISYIAEAINKTSSMMRRRFG